MEEVQAGRPASRSPITVRAWMFWKRGRGWAAGLLTFIVVWSVGLDVTIQADGIRDLLFARECLVGRTCGAKSTVASIGHLVHGTLWTRLLMAAAAVKLTPYGQGVVLIGAFAAAIGVVYGGVARYTRDSVAAGTSIGFIVLTQRTGFPEFSNEYMTVLPVALFFYGLARREAGDGAGWSLVGGLSLFCCAEGHVSFLVFLPLLVWFAGASPLSPGRHLAAAALGFVLPAAALSWDSYAANLRTDPRLSAGVVVAVSSALALATVCRSRWSRLQLSLRLVAIPITAVIWFGGVTLTAWLIRGWEVKEQYFAPVALPVAFLASAFVFALLDRVPRWWRAGGVAGLAAVLSVQVIEPALGVWRWTLRPENLTIRTLQTLGEGLRAQGWTYDQVRLAEGPGLWWLSGKIPFLRLILEPIHAGDRPPLGIPRIVVTSLRRAPSAAGRGWQAVPLGRDWEALISPIQPWVRPDHARLGLERDGVQLAAFELVDRWAPPAGVAGAPGNLDDMPFQDRGDVPKPDTSRFDGATVRYEFDIQVTGEDPERVVDVLDYAIWPQMPKDRAGWMIESISGLEHLLDPSGVRATLRRGASATGVIRLVRRPRSAAEPYVTRPPHLLETRPEEGAIRDAVFATPWLSSR